VKAVILAAGEGTRLRPFTISRPKVMIPVAGKPILEHVLRALVENGITEVVMVVGYRKERIMSYFEEGSRFGATISYAFQDKQLGTAHALQMASDQVDDDFLVVAGDNIIDARTIADLLKGRPPAMLVTRSDMPSKYGVVQVQKGSIISVVEKPEKEIGNIISTGIYWFTPDMLEKFKRVDGQKDWGITTVLEGLLPEMQLGAIPTTGRWIDAVYPWDLIGLNASALEQGGQRLAGRIESGVIIKGPVKVGEGTRIRSGSYIQGPVNIGEGCDIGPDVTIFPSTNIGDGVQVEPFSYIRQSLIMDNVRLGSHTHVSQSVLDDGVRMGPGCCAASGPAFSRVEDEFFRLDEIGALVGENTTMGAGVVLCPGCIIGASCRIGANVRVSDSLENRSVVC
jgi:UDP-N-acetylglucosamine diphosphorylase / glucose-1-phosphate thymidylyltransferase / UDP-N-acetylgalactosamine diphosphorylase / glucosamine-1-phosphate N-acetyltransferase / galactosamine-1-phosphate N-acetyltransferase